MLTFAGLRLFTLKYLFPFDFSLRATSPAALEAGREKEGELATTSLEFEYLYRKSRCEMLIVGDDISNDVSSIFHVFSFWKSYRKQVVFVHGRTVKGQSPTSSRANLVLFLKPLG